MSEQSTPAPPVDDGSYYAAEYPEAFTRTNGYVYVIKAETGHYKIGKSIRPDKRVNEFTLQLPYKVSLVRTFECENHHAVERALHDALRQYHVNGEWFLLPDNYIGWLVLFDWLSVEGVYGLFEFLDTPPEDQPEDPPYGLMRMSMVNSVRKGLTEGAK